MKKNQLSGIRLLAQKLNVSTATISRALNPETAHLVKEDRRKIILELADKLRYRPNPGARLIQRGVSPTITVLVNEDPCIFTSPFYGRLMSGMVRSTQGTEWDIHISTLKDTTGNILDKFRQVGLGCSGIIYLGRVLTTEEMDLLSQYHGPLVLLSSTITPDYPIDQVPCHVVGADHYNGAIAVANFIVEQGHRDIGLILSQDDTSDPKNSEQYLGVRDFLDRKSGYIDGLKKAKVSINEDMIFYGANEQETGRAGFDYFKAKKQMPTALICDTDFIAIGAMNQARDNGINCPNDISIIGFDDDSWATACSPKLTTIHQPLEELAVRSFKILTESILDSSADFRQHVILDTDLKIRKSVVSPRR